MNKTVVIEGYGPGISSAVAERFGNEGFAVALVARNAERLAAGVKVLAAKNIKAHAFTADLSRPDEARAVVGRVREALGPLDVVHWNVYGSGAGNLLTASVEELRASSMCRSRACSRVCRPCCPISRRARERCWSPMVVLV